MTRLMLVLEFLMDLLTLGASYKYRRKIQKDALKEAEEKLKQEQK